MTGPRLLMTGSRSWPEKLAHVVHDAIAHRVRTHPGLTVVMGDATGVDAYALAYCENHQVPHEVHRAVWDECRPLCPTKPHRRPRGDGTWCPLAGFARNQYMVDLGAIECLAFLGQCDKANCGKAKPHPSHGTTDCADRAEHAGIPVTPFGLHAPAEEVEHG